MQVRFASSRGARALCTGIPDAARPPVYRVLLPAMCLNRYYVAEGVRVFSQETWRMLMGDSGRQQVAEHIDAVVPYYVGQSKVGKLHECAAGAYGGRAAFWQIVQQEHAVHDESLGAM